MGLSFQNGVESYPPSKVQFLFNFSFGLKKNSKNNWLTPQNATKRAVIDDQGGGLLRLSGRGNTTKRAECTMKMRGNATKRADIRSYSPARSPSMAMTAARN
jgi:hypothetical protein